MVAKLLGLLLLCCLPLRHIRLTSGYGYRLHPVCHRLRLHAGIDLAARSDTVFAVLDGVVLTCRYGAGLGLYVQVDHGCGLQTVYGHLSQWLVMPGDTVTAGSPLGITGNTGLTTGEHLHFAVTFNNRHIDPLNFLSRMVISDTTKNN